MNQPERVPITEYDAALINRQGQRIKAQEAMLDLLRGAAQETFETLLLNHGKQPDEVGQCMVKRDDIGLHLLVFPKPDPEGV